MKILYINTTSVHGGAEEVLLKIMKGCVIYGHKPQLLVPAHGWLTEKCTESSIPVCILPGIPDQRCNNAIDQMKHFIGNNLSVAVLLHRLNIDIVHANTPRLAYHTGLACAAMRVPLVIHVHDIINSPYSSIPKAMYINYMSDATITVSDATKKAITARVQSNKIKRIYNGANISAYCNISDHGYRARFGIEGKNILFGTISAMTSWKGQDIVIRAFSLMASRMPEAKLIIVGGARNIAIEKDYEKYLLNLTAELRMRDRVIFTGWTEEAVNILKALDVFVHVPIQPDPLPTVIIHAMALGKPIIASNIGGIPEMINHGSEAVLVPPCNIEALAEIMLKLYSDETARQYYANKALAGSTRFDHDIMSNEINNVYLSVSRRHRTRNQSKCIIDQK